MQVPQQYQDLIDAGKKDPLETYRATYEGALATDIASIAQARAFLQGELNQLCLTKMNLPISGARIMAFAAGPGGAADVGKFFDAAQMLADGFPADKKVRLLYHFDKGRPNEAQADDDPAVNPNRTNRSESFEVRDLIYTYYTAGPDKVWAQIEKAVF